MRFPMTAASKMSDFKRFMPTPWSTSKNRKAGKARSASAMKLSAYDSVPSSTQPGSLFG